METESKKLYDNVDPDKVINIVGEKDETLFYCPLIDVGLLDSFDEIQDKMNEYLSKCNTTSDDRALALIGALCIEKELDVFLSEWIKNYKPLAKNKDFTFSFKIELANSLRLIPSKIFNSIEPIRKIRNIFAHNLEIDTFEKAKEFDSKADKPSFVMLYDKVKAFHKWEVTDDKRTFKHLMAIIILGLRVYTKHVLKLSNYIWNRNNLKTIIKS